MAISFKRYVDITSGIGAGATVRRRDLILRIFTTNALVPTGSVIEFTDDIAAGVLEYFGSSSEEYARASFYAAWVSKNITRAKKLAFARWAPSAVAARIFGDTTDKVLSSFTSVSNGSFGLNIGGSAQSITGVNLSGAASLAAVAASIQTAIQAKTGTQFTGATVVYNAARKSFDLTSGQTGTATIVVTAGTTGTDIAARLGWLSTSTILSDGAAAQTVSEVLTQSSEVSNNFGSFLFMPALTIEEVTEAAAWNATQNVTYMYLVPVVNASASAYSAALLGYAGTGVTQTGVAGEFPEQAPGMILAATDYNSRNSAQNYMFQQFDLTPTVTTTAVADQLDPLRVNYYGQTQTAGQPILFYQRGVLMGGSTAPTDMNVYANEIWLKDAAGTAVMELLLALARVSANAKGRVQLLAQLQAVINEALFNGVISVGKRLTQTQKLYISELTGDADAWQQIQNIGYWIDCTMQSYTTTDGRTEWKAVYTLVYSKDDIVRKVEGTHALI